MERLVKAIFNIIFIFGFHVNHSFSQSTCQSYTYFEVPGAQPLNPTTVANSDCRSYCLGNSACNGFTQQNGNCLLNTGDAKAIDYSASSVYTAISRNANSCNTAQNCYYSWVGYKNTFASGGRPNDMNTINSCIASCQSDNNCNSLDWDTNKNACFIFNFTGFPIASTTHVYHFNKTCLPNPTTIATTTLPGVSSQSTLPSSSSTTGTTIVTTTGSTTASRSQTSLSTNFPLSSATSPSTSVSLSTPISITNSSTVSNSSKDGDWYPLAIKPAYIVLAGLGGGCLLLVLTAVVILCTYPMNVTEVYSTDGVVVKRKSKKKAQAEEVIDMDSAEDANVERNPYYNSSEIGSPDLSKDTYLM